MGTTGVAQGANGEPSVTNAVAATPAGEEPLAEYKPVVSANPQDCSDITKARQLARSGITKIGCITIGSPSSARAKAEKKLLNEVRDASDLCTSGYWYHDRYEACGADLPVSYEVINTQNGTVVGGASFTARQEIQLSARDSLWYSSPSLKLVSAWGEAKGLTAEWDLECDTAAACASTDAWGGAAPIAVGGQL
ncbi:hypothetical protein ABZ078_26855 [Streptomyces sp. NPDC006385]|uniref:hypothetical protein n=1 Tax=Streptomyces sp. NPDC006385 TaxID=3156761 RepID=UPI0033A53C03